MRWFSIPLQLREKVVLVQSLISIGSSGTVFSSIPAAPEVECQDFGQLTELAKNPIFVTIRLDHDEARFVAHYFTMLDGLLLNYSEFLPEILSQVATKVSRAQIYGIQIQNGQFTFGLDGMAKKNLVDGYQKYQYASDE